MKPRLLIFIDWFYPGYRAGGPTASNVNIVDHLKHDFDIFVLTGNTDYRCSEPYEGIVADKWIEKDGYHVCYLSEGRRSFSYIKRMTKEADCQIWYVNGVYSKHFSIFPLFIRKCLKPQRVIISARGMLSAHSFLIKGFRKKCFLSIMKCLGAYKEVAFHGTNDDECHQICCVMGKNIPTLSVANLPRKIKPKFNAPQKRSGELRMVSFARVSPEKNTLYALESLTLCNTKVSYHIYGQINDADYWEKCLEAICRLPSNVTVEYKGAVEPSQLSTLYSGYDLMFMPSTGENFGHSILESFSNGRPVIISDRTPWQNLSEYGIGHSLSLDRQDDFAQHIDEFALLDNEGFLPFCERAYKFASDKMNCKEVKEAYVRMFRGCATNEILSK